MPTKLNLHFRSAFGGTTTDFPIASVGEHLPNGALILDECILIEGGTVEKAKGSHKIDVRESIVLAMQPEGFDKFVSWLRSVSLTPTATGEIKVVDQTWSGDYDHHIDKAVRRYRQRCKERQQHNHRKANEGSGA